MWTRCMTCWTRSMKFPLAHCLRRCACQSLASTRSRASDVLGEETLFASNLCTGKVCTVEMHHQRVDQACPGDNVGLNIKGLDKNNMPRSGDVMVYKKDPTLGQTKKFNAQMLVLDIPNDMRCGRAACRISGVKWKMVLSVVATGTMSAW